MYYQQSRGLRNDDIPSNVDEVHGNEDEDHEESDESEDDDNDSNCVDSDGRNDCDNDGIHEEEGSVGDNNKQNECGEELNIDRHEEQNEDRNTIGCGPRKQKESKSSKDSNRKVELDMNELFKSMDRSM
jgi:hypothetical protein